MNSNKGDIGAGVGFKDIRTGDTLCDEEKPIVLESMTFPDTVISIAVEPKSQADIAKLDNGLAKLAEEAPTFTVRTDEQSGQTITSGRATSSMEYDHHAPLSSTLAKAVLEEVKGRADLV